MVEIWVHFCCKYYYNLNTIQNINWPITYAYWAKIWKKSPIWGLFASKYKIKRFYEFYQTTNIFRAAQLEQIKIDYLIEIFFVHDFFLHFFDRI